MTVTELWLSVPDRRDPDGEPTRTSHPVFEELPATHWPNAPIKTRARLPFGLPLGVGWEVGGTALLDGRKHSFVAVPTAPPLDRSPLPKAARAEALATHAFLQPGETPGWLAIEPGSHEVLQSLVLPENAGLRIGPGTRFASPGMRCCWRAGRSSC